MTAPILEISGLSKKFCRDPHLSLKYFLHDAGSEILGRQPLSELRDKEFWALRDVSFSMQRGEVLGVVGHNGAGKSTLINLLAGVLRPTGGSIALQTDRVALVESGGGLDPTLTGRENIRNRLVLHGCDAKGLASRALAVAEFAGIGSLIDAPVGTYSLGMRQRLAFSIYTQLAPDLFIIDEALSGGDLRFSRKFAAFLRDYIGHGGSILLCSHVLSSIQFLCPRSILLDGGKLVADGDTLGVIDAYQKLCDDRDQHAAGTVAKIHGPPSRSEHAEEITIRSVVAEAEGGTRVRPRGALSIRIVFESSRRIETLRCGIEIGNAVLFPITSLHAGLDTPFSCDAGLHTLTFRIPVLPLNAGTYHAHVYLLETGKAVPVAIHGVQEQPCSFEVEKEINAGSNMAVFRNYIVEIEHEYFLTSGGVAGNQDARQKASGKNFPGERSTEADE